MNVQKAIEDIKKRMVLKDKTRVKNLPKYFPPAKGYHYICEELLIEHIPSKLIARMLMDKNIRADEKAKLYGMVTTLNLSLLGVPRISNLALLVNLVELDLSMNSILVLRHLDHLTQLTKLDLRYNKIEIMQGLNTLNKVTSLNLKENQIKQIEGIENMKMLEFFNIAGNRIQGIENLDYMAQFIHLIQFNIEGNPVCSDKEIDTYALAMLPQVRYYNNCAVTKQDVENARQYLRTEAKSGYKIPHSATVTKDKANDGKQLTAEDLTSKAFANPFQGDVLFKELFAKDADSLELLKLGSFDTELGIKVKESFDQFKKKFLGVTQKLFIIGSEIHDIRQCRFKEFANTCNALKGLVEKEFKQILEECSESKISLMKKINDKSAEISRSGNRRATVHPICLSESEDSLISNSESSAREDEQIEDSSLTQNKSGSKSNEEETESSSEEDDEESGNSSESESSSEESENGSGENKMISPEAEEKREIMSLDGGEENELMSAEGEEGSEFMSLKREEIMSENGEEGSEVTSLEDEGVSGHSSIEKSGSESESDSTEGEEIDEIGFLATSKSNEELGNTTNIPTSFKDIDFQGFEDENVTEATKRLMDAKREKLNIPSCKDYVMFYGDITEDVEKRLSQLEQTRDLALGKSLAVLLKEIHLEHPKLSMWVNFSSQKKKMAAIHRFQRKHNLRILTPSGNRLDFNDEESDEENLQSTGPGLASPVAEKVTIPPRPPEYQDLLAESESCMSRTLNYSVSSDKLYQFLVQLYFQQEIWDTFWKIKKACESILFQEYRLHKNLKYLLNIFQEMTSSFDFDCLMEVVPSFDHLRKLATGFNSELSTLLRDFVKTATPEAFDSYKKVPRLHEILTNEEYLNDAILNSLAESIDVLYTYEDSLTNAKSTYLEVLMQKLEQEELVRHKTMCIRVHMYVQSLKRDIREVSNEMFPDKSKRNPHPK